MSKAPATARVEKLAASVPETAAMTGLSRSGIYNLLTSGKLRSVTVGSRRLIPMSAIRELIGEPQG